MIVPTSWYVVAALSLSLLVTSCGWNNTYKTLNKERAEHQQVVKQFKDTQQEANRKAEAKRIELEEKGKKDAEQADANYADLYGKYRANLLRYQANQSGSSRSNRSQLPTAKGSPGSSGSTDVLDGQTAELRITLDDGRICAVNTARLQAVRDWAMKLSKD